MSTCKSLAVAQNTGKYGGNTTVKLRGDITIVYSDSITDGYL